MYGLCDCNNFYASCQRVFRPDLVGRPVVVLSNNDGCIIARSNEAKALGIGMGQPLYQVQGLIDRHGVAVFSANFALYGDMSRRVMATLRTLVPSVEVYSIDEAFFDLHGIAEPLDDYGRRIGRTIRRNTGIPVSIGIAPTKTLAKIASKLAKRYPKLDGCCYMHRPEDIEKVLATFPLHEVWGIGRRYGKLFDSMRITTARQFVELPEEWIHRRMGITGLRTWRELQGIECIGFEQMPQQKQQITVSRSFPKEIYEREELERIVAEFASMCAEKLRAQRALCGQIHGFIFTNRHRDDQPQRYETAVLTLPEPTDSTLEIVRQARAALRQIYRPGFGYKKAGVTLAQIVPATGVQGTLFAPPDKGKHARLMEALDRVNKVYGRGSIVIAAQGTEPFRMNREHLSPRYTTDWRELLTVKAKEDGSHRTGKTDGRTDDTPLLPSQGAQRGAVRGVPQPFVLRLPAVGNLPLRPSQRLLQTVHGSLLRSGTAGKDSGRDALCRTPDAAVSSPRSPAASAAVSDPIRRRKAIARITCSRRGSAAP